MVIRRATVLDAEGIANVRVSVWRTAYKDILSDEELNSLSVEVTTTSFARMIKDEEHGFFTYVVEDTNGEIKGFVSAGGIREQAGLFDCEIYAIYVLDEFQSKGIGSKLFLTAVGDLVQNGFNKMLIWVLKDNKFKKFYEKYGGKEVDSKNYSGKEIVSYGWDDIRKLKG